MNTKACFLFVAVACFLVACGGNEVPGELTRKVFDESSSRDYPTEELAVSVTIMTQPTNGNLETSVSINLFSEDQEDSLPLGLGDDLRVIANGNTYNVTVTSFSNPYHHDGFSYQYTATIPGHIEPGEVVIAFERLEETDTELRIVYEPPADIVVPVADALLSLTGDLVVQVASALEVPQALKVTLELRAHCFIDARLEVLNDAATELVLEAEHLEPLRDCLMDELDDGAELPLPGLLSTRREHHQTYSNTAWRAAEATQLHFAEIDVLLTE